MGKSTRKWRIHINGQGRTTTNILTADKQYWGVLQCNTSLCSGAWSRATTSTPVVMRRATPLTTLH